MTDFNNEKMIYAIRSICLKKIKIGESKVKSLFTRILSHQTGSADELELIGIHFGQFKTDKDIHPSLSSSHSHLEWFFETEEVDNFIQENFLIFPKPLSLLTDINRSTTNTISPLTIAVREYAAGNIKREHYQQWLDKFDMQQYIQSKLMR